jgi:2-oxoisovalerate dehydrogenase E1 component
MTNSVPFFEAVKIRAIEERFLSLFRDGMLNGTVHTCVGQEFAAVAFAGQLKPIDTVFSNHRCHGHFLAFTQDAEGLIAELMGRKNGVCAGIGSSQHLKKNNFYSNGIQGGIVPIAAGMALGHELGDSDAIAVVFIGDGTLGEGVVYESLNIVSKWKLPILIVCENNEYAQTTSIAEHLAGSIKLRALAFGIEYREGTTDRPDELLGDAKKAIDHVRVVREPLFFQVQTSRLLAHSKGDDGRDPIEIASLWNKDPIHKYSKENQTEYLRISAKIAKEIDLIVEKCKAFGEISLDEYIGNTSTPSLTVGWSPVPVSHQRQVQGLNDFFLAELGRNPKSVFIGEDVLSPYGGAFKVAKDLSSRYPKQVFTTPISELAICGIGNGLALLGFKPYVEIMFGDFIPLALDQILNHASKFKHMYNHQIDCPIVIRTPMGGRRGYGPTHSQTLDRLLMGIPNVELVALNILIDPALIYSVVAQSKNPVVVVENKTDYGKKIGFDKIPGYSYEYAIFDKYPIARIIPEKGKADYTIVTYGGTASDAHQALKQAFVEYEAVGEIFIFSKISPLDVALVAQSVAITRRLVIVEEGIGFAGFGSEVLSLCHEFLKDIVFQAVRVASIDVPIPAIRSLEDQIIPSVGSILKSIKKIL